MSFYRLPVHGIPTSYRSPKVKGFEIVEPIAGAAINGLYDLKQFLGSSTERAIEVNQTPDLVWIKNVSYENGSPHRLIDSVRGLGWAIDTGSDEPAANEPNGIISFAPGSFVLGFTDDSWILHKYNAWGEGMVARCWQKQVGAFDIVLNQSTGTAVDVDHALGVKPDLILAKQIDDYGVWKIYHSAATNAHASSFEFNADGLSNDLDTWNAIAPTATRFSLGANSTVNNVDQIPTYDGQGVLTGYSSLTHQHIFYLFAANAKAAFGSYVGSGSSNGLNIPLGFTVRTLLIKQESGGDWLLFDGVLDHPEYLYSSYANRQDPQRLYESYEGNPLPILLGQGFAIQAIADPWLLNIINQTNEKYLYCAWG